MTIRCVLMIVAALALGVGTVATADPRASFAGHRVLRLTIEPSQLGAVNSLDVVNLGLDWWRAPAATSHVTLEADLSVPPNKRLFVENWLSLHNISHSIMINDIEPLAQAQLLTATNAKSLSGVAAAADWFTAYHNYNDTVEWMQQLAKNYSSLASLVTIGISYEKRPIYALRITSNRGPAKKPQVLYDGGIHAREWIAPATVGYIAFQLITQYGKDPSVTALVDAIEWNMVPIFNVDGYQFTFTNNRMWRKTRKPNPGSICIGTDPCRNSADHWCQLGASKDPCSDTFCGFAAFDQPEVKALCDYAKNLGNLYGYINFHSYSQVWMSPWSYDNVLPPEPDRSRQRSVDQAAVAAIKAVHGLTYREGTSAQTLYPVSGDISDWIYAQIPTAVYSFCVELRDTGRYGFLLPPDQIIPTGEEIFAATKVHGNAILDGL